MEMSLNHIFDLLEENAPSLTVYLSNTQETPQTLSVLLVSGQSIYRLKLQQDGENRFWTISEKDYSMYFAMLESSRKEFQSTKCPVVSCLDQLNLWHSESNR